MIAQAPPAIAQIAQRVHDQEQATIVCRMQRMFDVHAGPMRRHDEMVLALAGRVDTTVRVRVIRDVVGGKTAGADEMAQLRYKYEHPAPTDVFHRPFDPRYLGEYTIEAIDAQTYRFTTSIRDAAHGNGTFSLDAAGNVVKYQYSPAVMPRYASTGTVIDERSQVLPNVWAVTRETQQYSGRYMIFGGGATVAIQYDSFRRYPDLTSAVAALDRME